MSDSKVKVTANKEGHVIVTSAKPSADGKVYGHIRVQQVRMVVDDTTGFAKMKPISALIPGTVNDLKGFGFEDQQEIEGKIRIVEQFHPFNKKDPDRDLKVAGKSGVTCMKDNKPIYRKHFWTPKASLEDAEIKHDNEAEIKQAYAELEGAPAEEGDNFQL